MTLIFKSDIVTYLEYLVLPFSFLFCSFRHTLFEHSSEKLYSFKNYSIRHLQLNIYVLGVLIFQPGTISKYLAICFFRLSMLMLSSQDSDGLAKRLERLS